MRRDCAPQSPALTRFLARTRSHPRAVLVFQPKSRPTRTEMTGGESSAEPEEEGLSFDQLSDKQKLRLRAAGFRVTLSDKQKLRLRAAGISYLRAFVEDLGLRGCAWEGGLRGLVRPAQRHAETPPLRCRYQLLEGFGFWGLGFWGSGFRVEGW
eukprot:603400-Rhodomonas_salina.1